MLQSGLGTMRSWRKRTTVGPSMMDIITNDNEGRQAADAETGLRDSDHRWCEPAATFPRKTATASWGRSVLIITALSTLAWTVVVLILVEALSNL